MKVSGDTGFISVCLSVFFRWFMLCIIFLLFTWKNQGFLQRKNKNLECLYIYILPGGRGSYHGPYHSLPRLL